MTDMLKSASDWLGSMFQSHASRSVAYARNANSVTVTATVGKTVHEVLNNLGLTVATESRDFIIPASQIVPTGTVTEPEAGDRITDTQSGTDYVYEVMPFGKKSKCFRYCDADHTTLRIHTKEVDRNT
jgi:hypothetical protein